MQTNCNYCKTAQVATWTEALGHICRDCRGRLALGLPPNKDSVIPKRHYYDIVVGLLNTQDISTSDRVAINLLGEYPGNVAWPQGILDYFKTLIDENEELSLDIYQSLLDRGVLS